MVFGKWFCWNRISGLNLNLMPKWASFCSWAIDCRIGQHHISGLQGNHENLNGDLRRGTIVRSSPSYFWSWSFQFQNFQVLIIVWCFYVFLKRSADLQRRLGVAFKSQKIKLQDKTAENLWRPGAQKDRSTPVVGQSCSIPPRTKLLVQPWVIQVWLIWIRLRCSRYSRYSRRYGRNGSTYRSKNTINLSKYTTFISKRCVF